MTKVKGFEFSLKFFFPLLGGFFLEGNFVIDDILVEFFD